MLSLIMVTLLVLSPVSPVETAPGETVAVYAGGTSAQVAETVVLVPGLTGCAYGFNHLAEILVASGCRVIVIEPLGVGASGRPPAADYSLTAQAERLARVIESERAKPCLVVAHGVAGSMALRLACRRPDLVRAVVSIEGGPDENSLTPTVERTLKLVSLAAKLGAKRLIRDRFKSSLEAASGDPSWINGITVRRYFKGFGRDISASIAVLRAMAKAQEPESLRANLHLILCPVLLMLGTAEHEGGPPAEAVATLRTSLPDFQLLNVAGAGHFIFEEQPDVVAQAVLDLALACRVRTSAIPAGSSAVLAERKGETSCAQ